MRCEPVDFRPLIEKGMAIKHAIMDSRTIPHPFEPDLSFLYGTIFVGPPRSKEAHSRNVCIFAEGEVDRCPTGTGVSARLAIHHARGEIDVEAMGHSIKERFREKVRAALQRQYVGEFPDSRKRTPEEVEAELAAFDQRADAAQQFEPVSSQRMVE